LSRCSACEPSASSDDPCTGVTCSFYGICISDGIAPYCSCERGFHPIDRACAPNDPDNPCDGVDCNAHGNCFVEAGFPVCECYDGYARDRSGMLCLEGIAGADADADADVAGDSDVDDEGVAEDAPEDSLDAGDGTDDGGPPPTIEMCGNGMDDDGLLNPSAGGMVADPPCGTLKWQSGVGGCGCALALSPTRDLIVMAGPSERPPQRVVALAPDGTERWTVEVGASASHVVIDEYGSIYLLQPASGNVIALRPDGSEKWRRTASGLGSFVALRGANLYVPEDGGITIRDAADGSVVGVRPVTIPGGQQLGYFSIDPSDGVLALSTQGCNVAMPASLVQRIIPDGSVSWSFPMASCSGFQPTIDREGNWAVSTEGDWGLATHREAFYRTPDNTLRWTWRWSPAGENTDISFPDVLIGANHLVFGVKSVYPGSSPTAGCLSVLDRHAGGVVWEDCTRNATYNIILGEGNAVYAARWRERLVAYDLDDGDVRWELALPAPSRAPWPAGMALGEDGTLYVTHQSGWSSGCTEQVYAVWTDSVGGLAADAPWPKFARDSRSTSAADPAPGGRLVEPFDVWNPETWEGHQWCFNTDRGAWSPGVAAGAAVMRTSDYCWGQLRTTTDWSPTVEADVRLSASLASGGTNGDVLFVGFATGWPYYGGHFAGAIIHDGNVFAGTLRGADWAEGPPLRPFVAGRTFDIHLRWLAEGDLVVASGENSVVLPAADVPAAPARFLVSVKDSSDGALVEEVTIR
jgi:hypothetical protein